MKLLGVDVSVGRTSQTALFIWDVNEEVRRGRMPIVENLDKTTQVTDLVAQYEEKEKFEAIGIDAMGVGRGVLDQLQAMPFGHKVVPFIANTRASREWEDEDTKLLMDKQFANYKTRVAWEFRRDAFKGKIRIPADMRLRDELLAYKLQKSNSRWKLVDPKRSPDVADSALIGYSLIDEGNLVWIGS